jgi:hypothetical protein
MKYSVDIKGVTRFFFNIDPKCISGNFVAQERRRNYRHTCNSVKK